MNSLKNEPLILYNIFPRLLGNVKNWYLYVDKAKEMLFNAIYINPIHYTGFSGSLYAIKDYYAYNPMFFDGKTEKDKEKQFVEFVNYCHKKGLKVILDLVINHTARDSHLTVEHKNWYKLKDGKIESPGVWAGNKKIVEWGDLAEIDNANSPDKKNLWNYWKKLIHHYIENLKVDGFRCDAAYQVPNELWSFLIEYAKSLKPDTLFLAESLGCTIKETIGLVKAGFDYVFNSSKYWDFTEDWCLEQQILLYKNKARSISFPESHDTERLYKESNGNIEYIKLRYLFACTFSTGVMMPLGYEYGFEKKTDVIKTTPDDFEEKKIDISDYIKKCNELKFKYRLFSEDSEIRRITDKYDPVLGFIKIGLTEKEKALVILNKDWHNYKRFYNSHLYALLQSDEIKDISVEYPMIEHIPDNFEYWLRPSQIKILYSTVKNGGK